MTIKHATAGAFVFARIDGQWNLGLIFHPRLQRWMIPGGHVENHEHCADAAEREVQEETGLKVSILSAPRAVPVPSGYPHPPVPAPWWITELQVPADNHVDVPHVHIDHQYVAIVVDLTPVCEPAHEVRWFSEADIAGAAMFGDTRLLATALYGCIDSLAEGDSDLVLAALSQS